MANKFKVAFHDNKKTMYEALGLSEKRFDELHYRMQLIIHEIQKPTKKNEEGPASDVMVKMIISLAENVQELAFLAYSAGIAINKVFDTEDEFEEDFDDDWRE